MTAHEQFRIGELADRSGHGVQALRFYERLGLLGPARRSAGNQRLYGPDALVRLHKIGQLKQVGLSLEEIADVLPLYFGDDGGLAGKKRVLAILRRQLEETETRLTDLAHARDTLKTDIARIEGLVRDLEQG